MELLFVATTIGTGPCRPAIRHRNGVVWASYTEYTTEDEAYKASAAIVYQIQAFATACLKGWQEDVR